MFKKSVFYSYTKSFNVKCSWTRKSVQWIFEVIKIFTNYKFLNHIYNLLFAMILKVFGYECRRANLTYVQIMLLFVGFYKFGPVTCLWLIEVETNLHNNLHLHNHGLYGLLSEIRFLVDTLMSTPLLECTYIYLFIRAIIPYSTVTVENTKRNFLQCFLILIISCLPHCRHYWHRLYVQFMLILSLCTYMYILFIIIEYLGITMFIAIG